MKDNVRLLKVTAGNIRNSHIYITGHHDFFPPDCIGGSSREKGRPGNPIRVEPEGMNTAIETDIARDGRTGKPRREFRQRSWVRKFFSQNAIAAGDVLRLERLDVRSYRISLAKRNGNGASSRTFAEFFAGIGLVRMGLEAKGWSLAFANDMDLQKYEMYDGHFHDAQSHFDTTDVHLLDPDSIPNITLATASFPCTDLSLAGGREGLKGSQSSAFFGFIDVLRKMGDRKPLLVLLENVTAFLSSHQGRDFRQAMLALNELGYSVDPFILDAKWFVPQSRPRLFVAAIRGEGQGTEFSLGSRIRPPALIEYIAANPDIRWNLRSLPEPPSRSSRKLRDIIESLSPGHPDWWNRERREYLLNQMSDRHRRVANSWIAKRSWSYGTVFRRVRKQPDGVKRSMAELRSDGLAGCLRTPKGGSGRQILFKAGYGTYAVRLLTPRECARLMGADDFAITVPKNQAYFGFGDAVCVPAISWIAENYLNPVLAEQKAVSAST